MTRRDKMVAMLLAGAASTGLQAQAVAPTAPAQQAPAPTIQFRGADGKPLPPELQRQLEEQFRNDPQLLKNSIPAPPGATEKDVVVTAQRPRGSVVGDIPPERTFNPIDIKAFGASDLGEFLDALGPQVSSGRGREDGGPIVLLNGKRVSSFVEIAKIPTEAIERTEIFPEELALKYGYRADQKVVNVVTFERFSSRVGQLTYAAPTEGGRDTVGGTADYLHIRGDLRFNLDADYNRSGFLLESERGVRQVAGAPDLGRFRTLLPGTERLALNGGASGHVLSDVSSTFNVRVESNSSDALLGLGANGPLRRDIDTDLTHLGTALDGALGKWRWSFTGNYDRVATDTLTDTGDVSGTRDEARAVNALTSADLVVSGTVLNLPAGPISANVRGGGEMRDFDSRSLRGGIAQRTALSRDLATVQANVDIPIASRGGDVLPWLGNLSANANLQIDELSDFGTLWTSGYGLNWSPTGAVNVIASVTNEVGAPSVDQLGAPLIVTPNVRTVDFTRGETVDVTRVFGGNPDLRSDRRHVFKLGFNARPFAKTDLTLNIDYLATTIGDPIAAFPVATPAIEATFPDRFTRDAGGRLLRIDSRPLNFRRSDQKQLRWGINFTRPLGSVPEMQNAKVRFFASEADAQRMLPPGAKMTKVEAGSPAARRFENMTSRVYMSFYHSWRLEDDILLRDAGPVLDLLNGSAIGSRGGRPRHELELQAGAFKRGFGTRVSATWQDGTVVRDVPAGAGGGAGDLRFSDYAIVNINLFANLGDRLGGAKAPSWLKGTRAGIGVTNLFNTRPAVRDEGGATPLIYQPAYLDPLGRAVNFSLRKVF